MSNPSPNRTGGLCYEKLSYRKSAVFYKWQQTERKKERTPKHHDAEVCKWRRVCACSTYSSKDRQEYQTTTTVQKSTDWKDEEVLQVFKILTMMSNLAINPAHMTRISMSKLQVALALSQEFRKTLVILLRKELRGLMGGLRTEPKGYAIKKKLSYRKPAVT